MTVINRNTEGFYFIIRCNSRLEIHSNSINKILIEYLQNNNRNIISRNKQKISENSDFSARRPRFYSQHPHRGSQSSVTSILGIFFWSMRACIWYTDNTCRQNIYIHEMKYFLNKQMISNRNGDICYCYRDRQYPVFKGCMCFTGMKPQASCMLASILPLRYTFSVLVCLAHKIRGQFQ